MIAIGKKWIVLIVAVLLAVGLFSVVYFWPSLTGEPRLRLEFFPPPPWKVKAGDTLEVTVGIPNDGKDTARGVRLSLLVPEGFTGFIMGTNEKEITIGTIHGFGHGRASDFVIAVSSGVLPGNYTITVKLSGENVPELVFTAVIEVQTS